jgi:hypothetical protein
MVRIDRREGAEKPCSRPLSHLLLLFAVLIHHGRPTLIETDRTINRGLVPVTDGYRDDPPLRRTLGENAAVPTFPTS